MLYFAARSENIENVIKKNYNKKIIILDSFIDSTSCLPALWHGFKHKSLIININNILLKKLNQPKFF